MEIPCVQVRGRESTAERVGVLRPTPQSQDMSCLHHKSPEALVGSRGISKLFPLPLLPLPFVFETIERIDSKTKAHLVRQDPSRPDAENSVAFSELYVGCGGGDAWHTSGLAAIFAGRVRSGWSMAWRQDTAVVPEECEMYDSHQHTSVNL